MSTTPGTNATVCAISSPVFVSPSYSDNLHPGDEVKITWVVASNYSASFGCSLSLRSLRLPLSLPILTNASVPTYPSTLTYNQTQISYTDPGVPCGSRSVSITWLIPQDYNVPSDPNFIITAYSYGAVNGIDFADTFNSEVFRIADPIPVLSTNSTITEPPASPSSGLQQGAIIGIAIGAALAVISIGLTSWCLWRRKRNGSHNENNKNDGFVRSLSRRLSRIQIPRINEPTLSAKGSSNFSSTGSSSAGTKVERSCTGATRSEAGGNELFELPGSPSVVSRPAKPVAPKVYYELENGDEAWEMAGDMPQGWDPSSHHPRRSEQYRTGASAALTSPMMEEPERPKAFHVAQCVDWQTSVPQPASRRTSKARIVSIRRSTTFASVSEMSDLGSPGLASESSGMRSPRHLV